MPSGTVKWFNNAKGYGFILASDGVSDVFAHYSAINIEGYKTLKAGQEVSYDLAEGQKGLHASNIMPLINTEASEPEAKYLDHLKNGNG
ncbi:cold-shock protein [Porticoccus sp.]|uniref:cold-shock protein n=1 Tax=Porticoccus sp. TaxID=2024853 RepID=UPI003F698A61